MKTGRERNRSELEVLVCKGAWEKVVFHQQREPAGEARSLKQWAAAQAAVTTDIHFPVSGRTLFLDHRYVPLESP